TNLFNFAMYIEVVGKSEDDLDDRTAKVRNVLSQSNARVTPLYDRQMDVQRSLAPLGTDPVRNTQVMDTAEDRVREVVSRQVSRLAAVDDGSGDGVVRHRPGRRDE
ncbi:MAG: hypothetical protein ABEI99_05190, partial [Halobaculum sp.]